jgi:hypothetical protein
MGKMMVKFGGGTRIETTFCQGLRTIRCFLCRRTGYRLEQKEKPAGNLQADFNENTIPRDPIGIS